MSEEPSYRPVKLIPSLTLALSLAVVIVLVCADTAPAQMEDIPPSVRPKLERQFARVDCAYPARSLTFVVLKEEMELEVWCEDDAGVETLVAVYPVLAASGIAGPKLAQGDCQVPEGIYSVVRLNPYSRFHLSMKIDYPNRFDREKGICDGRSCLGDDIFIHGKDVSKGCIAVGDDAIEELFQMVYDMDGGPVKVVIAPYDFRTVDEVKVRSSSTVTAWLPELYEKIDREMSRFVISQDNADTIAKK